MSTKIRVIVLATFALFLLIGVWLSRSPEVTVDKGAEDERSVVNEREGVVTAVDLTAIAADGPARVTFASSEGSIYTVAIPSMNLPLCVAREAIASLTNIEAGDLLSARGTLSEDGAIVPCDDPTHYLRIERNVIDSSIGLSFTYLKSPNGYVADDTQKLMSASPDFVKGFVLIAEDAYEELQATEEVPREGPPAITIYVYRNTQKLWPAVWASRHPLESNIERTFAEPTETSVGGAKSITYTADGLYVSDIYVVTSGSYVYVFSGSYMDALSPLRRDFKNIVSSVSFIPEKE